MHAAPRWIILLLIGSLAAAASAQQQNRENLKASGTFRGAVRGGFQLATEDNELWNVKLPQKAADVSFTGNADASFLQPGMMVKFSGVLNKRGQLAEPITQLVVFTPLDRTDIGVWPENAGDGAPSPLEGLFSSEEKKEPPKAKPTRKIAEDQPYRIGGRLTSIKGDKLIIAAGPVQVKADLADDAKIRVSVSSLAFAQPGDKVEVEGWYYANAKQAGAQATSVTVTAANLLEGEKKKTRTADDDDAPEKSSDKSNNEQND